MPSGRFNPSRTTTDPSEGEIAPASPTSVDLPTAHLDLASVVEAAKARSREAMTAKIQKSQAKARKASNLTSDKSYCAQKVAAQELEQVWREEMSQAFADIPQIAWFKYERGKLLARKEGKLAADLLDGYGGDLKVCEGIIQSFIRNWALFGPMLTKQQGGIPTFGLLYACHATIVAESARLRTKSDAITEYEAWIRANAGDAFAVAPPELEAAYRAALAKKGKK